MRKSIVVYIDFMEDIANKIRSATKTYKDFPKPGVNFIDIFPIVSNP